MIRRAERTDIPAMVRMGRDFVAAADLPLAFNSDWAERSLTGHMAHPDRLALVLSLNAGVCGMLCAGWVMSPLAQVRIASELVFWIDPHARGRWWRKMIVAYEFWARDQGCAMASLVAVGTRGADKLYARAGYVPGERNHYKRL